MRSLVALALLLAVPSAARADYSPPPLSDLVLTSDAIVTGEITDLSADAFRFAVSEVAYGPMRASSVVEVERFVDWTCSARWAPYAVGQRALLFLERGASGRWRIRSAGGEGEMPIAQGRVHVDGSYAELAPAGTNVNARHSVHGGTYVGFILEERAFVEALRRSRAAFAADVEGRRIARIRVTGSEAELRALASSPVGAALERALTPR